MVFEGSRKPLTPPPPELSGHRNLLLREIEGNPADRPLRRAELEALIRHHTSGDRYEQQG